LTGNAEAQVISGGIVKRRLIAYFIGNMCTKKISKSIHVRQSYSKPNLGCFLRHGVGALGYISVAESLRISSTTFTQCAPKATKFAEITQHNGHYAVQGHSRSPILVAVEISCTTSY